MVSPEHRVEMLKIATANDGRIKVCDYEIKHKLHGETYFLLNRLIHDSEYEFYRFGIVIGQDRANTIANWYNSEELLKMDVPFIVAPRQGYKRDSNVTWFLERPHIYIEKEGVGPVSKMSSTMFRNLYKDVVTVGDMVKCERFAKEIVGFDVFKYIRNNELYNLKKY